MRRRYSVELMLLRSIPLSKVTRDAWHSAGVHIVRRSEHECRRLNQRIERERGRGLINLGNLSFPLDDIHIPVFNSHDSIRAVSSPNALRRTLDDFIPPYTIKGPHWHKRGGFGGKGKVFHEDLQGECPVIAGDSQQHVEGVEYRVISVGDRVVQASRKDGDVFNGFDWTWVGVNGIRSNGTIPLVKQAVDLVPNGAFTVFGWDIIVGDRPYIIECNTSPGVNEATAGRIVDQIERILS